MGLFQKSVSRLAIETAFLVFSLCLIKIFFSIWTIRFGRSLPMLVIHTKKCTGSMITTVSLTLSSIIIHSISVVIWSYGQSMPMVKLNRQRYLYPLEAVGAGDSALAEAYEKDALATIPTKSKLMPHAREVLEYLSAKYNLYILSNGFKELQFHKMRSSNIDKYFRKVVLSDDIGILKPWPEIFHFALSATQSELNDSLMIGDSWENDIAGAAGVGMHQVFYNLSGRTDLPFTPTYQITDLKELLDLL